jgi:SAM-dependent methyltransferase
MSQRTLEAHYRPNNKLSKAIGVTGYNCGYAEPAAPRSFDRHQRTLVWRLLGDTPINHESTVLDVGCGIGGPSAWIMDRFRPRRLIGLDYLGTNVRTATEHNRTEYPRMAFFQADAHCLPVADASVDVIFNLESALHYADKNAFLSECRRVLRPGGTLCLGDITTRYKALFAPLMLLNRLPTQFNSNIWLWSADDYLAAFPRLGLQVLRHEQVSRRVAASLANGLAELDRLGWAAAKGFRTRCAYLAVLRTLLSSRGLSYDLFTVRRPAR